MAARPAGHVRRSVLAACRTRTRTASSTYQTYSKSTAEHAGEAETNKVFDGTFQFISTSADYQPGLFLSVSPDNGLMPRRAARGCPTSSLEDTPTVSRSRSSDYARWHQLPVRSSLGTVYSRNEAHTVRFLIETVPGETPTARPTTSFASSSTAWTSANELDACFTTWEQWYRVSREQASPASSTASSSALVALLSRPSLGGGYLYDNVETITRADEGPAAYVCGVPHVGVIAPTATTCSQYRDGTAPALVGGLQYTTTKTKSGTTSSTPSLRVCSSTTRSSRAEAGDAVVITQTNNGTPAPYAAIPVQQGQTVLYDAVTCAKVKWGPRLHASLPDGDYIIGVKYDASSLKGKALSDLTAGHVFVRNDGGRRSGRHRRVGRPCTEVDRRGDEPSQLECEAAPSRGRFSVRGQPMNPSEPRPTCFHQASNSLRQPET